MIEHEKKKPFWTTLPGVLTGVAAIITALTGLFLAMNGNQARISTEPEVDPAPVTPTPNSPTVSLPSEWPIVGEETFSNETLKWKTGNMQGSRFARSELSIVSGKYRWDTEVAIQNSERFTPAPYGPATDFYTAVDVRIVSVAQGDVVAASLLFGRASNADYAFKINSKGKYALTRFDGQNNKSVINWTPGEFNPMETNRLAVAVENQVVKLYINSHFAGSYRDPLFTGGKVGLSVTGYKVGLSSVVDFDNFEYRRKP